MHESWLNVVQPQLASRFHCSAQAVQAPVQQDARPSQAVDKQKLHLFNTMERQKRAFEPRQGCQTVSMYVCGVTVYDW